MSSIVIAGDTSGSVTLQAPAVSGSTILTLPATSGTVQTSGAGFTTNGVAYASSTSALATNSALTFDGSTFILTGVQQITNSGGSTLILDRTSNAGSLQLNYNGTQTGQVQAASGGGLIFYQGSTPTEGMRLTSTGLGIGTTNINAKLSFTGSSYASTDTPNIIRLFDTGTASSSFGFGLNGAKESVGQLGIYGGDASTIGFFTGGLQERARITQAGYFKASNSGTYANATGNFHEFVNSSADNLIKFRNSNASNPYGFPITYSAASPNGTGNAFWDCDDTGGARGAFRSNGGLANYSANNVNLSDRREKTNFAPATSYLDKICAIPVQTFNYIDQNMEDDGGLTLGVVAQDVQAVAPELVMESNWASKDDEPKMRLSIYQTDLQYALMKCIQEQQTIIESLKARLDAANL